MTLLNCGVSPLLKEDHVKAMPLVALQLLNSLLVLNPSARISLDNILLHPFLTTPIRALPPLCIPLLAKLGKRRPRTKNQVVPAETVLRIKPPWINNGPMFQGKAKTHHGNSQYVSHRDPGSPKVLQRKSENHISLPEGLPHNQGKP